jgi:Flp pilus assembly pilin Flp
VSIAFAAMREQTGIHMKSFLTKLIRDEQGGEVMEYVLIAGLIIVTAIVLITSVGTKVVARWSAANASNL